MKSLTAELTSKQKEDKSFFLLKLKHMKKGKNRLSPAEQVTEYLKEVYGVDVPKNFPEELYAAYATFHCG